MDEVEELEDWLISERSDFVRENIFKYAYSEEEKKSEKNTVKQIVNLLND